MAESAAVHVGIDGPHQPRFATFPKRSFGNKTVVWRSFQPSWFNSFSWLHYDENRDVAYCYVCMRASKEKKLATKCTDQAFISKGFHNWKDATVAFNKHEKTGCHKDAVQMTVVLPKCYRIVVRCCLVSIRLTIGSYCTKYLPMFATWHAKGFHCGEMVQKMTVTILSF